MTLLDDTCFREFIGATGILTEGALKIIYFLGTAESMIY